MQSKSAINIYSKINKLKIVLLLAKIFIRNGIGVFYIKKFVVTSIIQDKKICSYLINQILKEWNSKKEYIISLEKYLKQLSVQQFINKIITCC
ncbi:MULTISPECIES: hypothetical protein [Spiroplasma]|uniref:Uncharacterized protein n=2 Tax=Spiroplasma TaxID=2132 RepID=A0ABM8BZ51_9MOLU|nr:hypothetical protein [Spiroplasma ixodetis]BDT05013.1 hypothetical protein SHM_26590 [Spiroplasma ixodetis]